MDFHIFRLFFSLANKSAIADWFILFFANFLPYLLVISFILLIFKFQGWKKKIWFSVFGALSVILARGILVELIRFFSFRPRPSLILELSPLIEKLSPSFPSGHASLFFALAVALWFFNKKWGLWFAGISFIMSLARISAGTHWPSDILGGVLVGMLASILVFVLLYKTIPGAEKIMEE